MAWRLAGADKQRPHHLPRRPTGRLGVQKLTIILAGCGLPVAAVAAAERQTRPVRGDGDVLANNSLIGSIQRPAA